MDTYMFKALTISFILSILEWPVYFEGPANNRKKVQGNINVLQFGSNVVDYTILLELYSFVDNETRLKAIGQKLKAIFNTKVTCFTGCRQKADYTKLINQYPQFDLPQGDIYKLFDDVSTMAVNRGLTVRGKERTTLQALCRGQEWFIRKTEYIRVGTCFASKHGQLPQEAQLYCQLDVEAPLLLHDIYKCKPDLMKRMTNDTVRVGMTVDIMPESSSNIKPIAQGVVKQVGGRVWESNGQKMTNKHVIVSVKKVFQKRGIIHYPSTTQTAKKCRCGRLRHGNISKQCDFYLYSQFGPVSFDVLELKSRLRPMNEQVEYPQCVYVEGASNEVSEQPYFEDSNEEYEPDDTVTGTDDGGDDVTNEDENDDLSPAVIALVDEDDRDESDGVTTAEDGRELSPQEIRRAKDLSFNETLQKILDEADALAGIEEKNKITEPSESDLPVDELPELESSKFCKVLGDIFHLMDRAKTPMHHEYKSLYFRCLRSAMFIMNKDDVDDVKEVLASKGQSWEEKMAFDFSYIAKRVRRKVPPPEILYQRLLAVFNFFKDKVDSKTSQKLFNERNQNKFLNVLAMVKDGYATDPPGLSLYVEKTDNYGRKMVDEDGLQLYRSVRGTSNLESLHQYLTTSFGHTVAGPYYSDCLLTILRHFYNWRMSRKNRPGFPRLHHYNGLLIDRINSLYELIYGYPKYRNWSSFNDSLPWKSPYGIVEVERDLVSNVVATEEDGKELSKNRMLSYLAKRQKSPVPFLPIRGKNERKLVHVKLNEIVAEGQSLTNVSVFEKLCKHWNTDLVDVKKKRFPKMPNQIAKYVKGWRKNRDRRDAATASGANRLVNALEYVPESESIPAYEPVALNIPATPNNPTDNRPANLNPEPANLSHTTMEVSARADSTDNGLQILCQACSTQQTQPVEKPSKTKTCQGPTGDGDCPDPIRCPGKSNRDNCIKKTGGDPTKKVKRKAKVSYRRKCFVCKQYDCKGKTGRSNCPNYVESIHGKK